MIFHRESAGWVQIASEENWSSPQRFITGFPAGPVLLFGSVLCGIRVIENGGSSCNAGVSDVPDLYVVRPSLAYALQRDRTLVLGGADWVQYGSPFPAGPAGNASQGKRIWADLERVVVLSGDGIDSQVFASGPNGVFEQFAPPADIDYDALWSFTGGEIWLGGRDGGLVSYDGAWSRRAELRDSCEEGIKGMWGADGVLYVHTGHRLARWTGGELEVIHEWPCGDTLRAVWGNSPSEVFVVASDAANQPEGCGPAAIFRFDGNVLEQL